MKSNERFSIVLPKHGIDISNCPSCLCRVYKWTLVQYRFFQHFVQQNTTDISMCLTVSGIMLICCMELLWTGTLKSDSSLQTWYNRSSTHCCKNCISSTLLRNNVKPVHSVTYWTRDL